MGVPTTQTKPKQQQNAPEGTCSCSLPSQRPTFWSVWTQRIPPKLLIIFHGELMITLSTVGSWWCASLFSLYFSMGHDELSSFGASSFWIRWIPLLSSNIYIGYTIIPEHFINYRNRDFQQTIHWIRLSIDYPSLSIDYPYKIHGFFQPPRHPIGFTAAPPSAAPPRPGAWTSRCVSCVERAGAPPWGDRWKGRSAMDS